MIKERARAGVDDAFERQVGDLFRVLMASAGDKDAPIRFGHGVTKATEVRARAMAIIDSFPNE